MDQTEENRRGAVVVCTHVASGKFPILLAERPESDDSTDTGWQFVCNAGFEETAETGLIWLLDEVLKIEPSLRDYILPPGTTVIRDNPSSPWETVTTEDLTGHTLAYDTNFNLSGYDAWSYVYDADKRLISASGSGTAMGQGHSAQFVYDGLGRCVKRTIDNVTTLITYDGWKPIAEWNGAGGLVAWNLYGPGADEILVRYDANAGHLYYHLDAHGHVRFLLNGNGEVIEKYTYDAFGQPKIMDGNGGETATTAYDNRFLFTGREYLSALGLYDYRHRVYHPGLGRFLQVDPLGLQIEAAKLSARQAALFPAGTAPKTFSSSELNLYRYCHSDPVNKNDPTGLVWTPMSTKDKKDYEEAKAHESKSEEGKRLFDRIEKSRTAFTLKTNNRHDDRYDPKTKTIHWDPKSALKTTDGGKQSPATGLAHEIAHALTNPILSAIRLMIPAGKYDNMEEARVIKGSERAIVRDLGEGMREDHDGTEYHVQSPADK